MTQDHSRPAHSRPRRTASVILATTLIWSQLAQVAVAVPTDLADTPMATAGRAKPNLIFVVDDSGSMDSEFSPIRGFSTNDGAGWWNTTDRRFIGRDKDDLFSSFVPAPAPSPNDPIGGPFNFNRLGTADATWKKYGILFPNGVCGANCDSKAYNDASDSQFSFPPTREFAYFHSPVYNAQYYNPAVNYDPWRPYHDGTTLRTPQNYDNTGTGLWTAVRSHPYYPTPTTTSSTFNLTVPVPKPTAAPTDKVFRMYPGMIMPANATYRVCTSADGSTCGAWVAAPATDTCLGRRSNEPLVIAPVPGTAGASPLVCPNAFAYGVATMLAFPNFGAFNFTDGVAPRVNVNHADVQIAYAAASYWERSTSVGPLPANEAYGPDRLRLRYVLISAATPTYTKLSAARTDCPGTVCTYAQEMTNYANWFAYYRKRHLMLNGAMGLAFDQVKGLRGGYFLFNNLANVTMYDFDQTSDSLNGKRLLGQLYKTKGTGGTPTRPALEYAGRQFERTDGNAPIQAACQYNAAFVLTDGFATNSAPSGSYGNADSDPTNRFTIPYDDANLDLKYDSNPNATVTTDGNLPLPPVPLTNATAFTPSDTYRDNWSNTLADIAMHFYSTNLRPLMAPIRQVPVDINDIAKDSDRQDYLHMTTFALGLGVQGVIFNNSAFPDQNRDPYAFAPDWNVVNPTTQVRSPTSIDELWHATINSRGLMLSASAPEEARSGVVDVVNNVGARGGSGASVAVSNPNLTPGDSFSYQSSYNSGSWSGDINKFAIDPSTGVVSETPSWNPGPQRQLVLRDPATRILATYDGASAVPFQWASIGPTLQNKLTFTPLFGVPSPDPDVLDFLRGVRTKEVEKFRSRGPRPPFATGTSLNNISVLGDIVNGEPVVIGAPLLQYFDSGYSDFRTAQALRPTTVYQGANDGIFHAIAGADGSELWGYVPYGAYPNLSNLAERNVFTHKYTVDGSPTFSDVDFSFTSGNDLANPPASNWKTIVIGSLRKGGFGYFALDATTPSALNETDLLSKVLWEFPNNTLPVATKLNVGYSFGRPVIVKTRAAGWVAVLASGYNNGTGAGSSGGDGVGRIWILNIRTGGVIAELTTSVGTAAAPSGLAHLASFVARPDVDPTAEAVYGGDLLGNLWRLDVSGANVSNWSVTRMATLTDSAGNIQPISSEPELGTVNRERFVYIGAGQYIGDSDVPSNVPENIYASRKMSFYGLKDTPSVTTSPVIVSPIRSTLVQQVITKGANTATLTSNPVPGSAKGWYIDFTEDAERSVTNPILSGGVLTFTSNIPVGGVANPCTPGGKSWVWFIDYATGGKVTVGTTPPPSGKFLGNVLSSRVVLVRLPNGNVVGLVRGSDSKTQTVNPPNSSIAATGRRLSWREIVQ